MVAGVALYRDQKETRGGPRQGQGAEFVTKLNAAGLPGAESRRPPSGCSAWTAARTPQDPDEELLQSQYAWQLGTAGAASRP